MQRFEYIRLSVVSVFGMHKSDGATFFLFRFPLEQTVGHFPQQEQAKQTHRVEGENESENDHRNDGKVDDQRMVHGVLSVSDD